MRDFLTYAEYRAKKGLSSYATSIRNDYSVSESANEESKIEKLIKKQLKKFAKSNDSVFSTTQLNNYIKKQTGLSDEDIMLFDSDISSFVQKLNDENVNTSDDMTSDDVLLETLNTLFEDETISKELDLNNDGSLDDSEKEEFLTSLIGANEENDNAFTYKDLMSTVQGLMSGMSLEDAINQAQASNFALDNPEDVSYGPLSKPNTHTSNYTPTDGKRIPYSDNEDVKKIEEQINSTKDNIQAKTDEKTKLVEQIGAANETYMQLVSDISTFTSNINAMQTEYRTMESELHNTQMQLSAKTAELANIAEPAVLTDLKYDYSEVDANGEISTKEGGSFDQYKAGLEAEVKELEGLVQTQTQALNAKKQEIATEEGKKATAEQEQRKYEDELNNPDLDTLNNDIDTLKDDLSKLEQQREQKVNEIKKNDLDEMEVFGKNAAFRQSEFTKFMLDYATDPATKAYYDKWYYEKFNGKAYCAVFTSNVVEVMYAQVAEKLGLDLTQGQGVQGNQFSMESQSWGRKIQAELQARGINTIPTVSIEKMSAAEKKEAVKNGLVYPGMVFEYTDHQGNYHTGFIESINADLTYNTIEGNVQIKYEDGSIENHTVGAKKGIKVEDKGNFSGVTDPTMKVLCWLKDLGYSDAQINALLRSEM